MSTGKALRYILALTSLASAAAAYTYFGKNKVQYYRHDWQILRGDHVDLYFYTAERELAERAIVAAEEAWDELSLRLAYTPRHRVPLIIYSSHSEFQETHILPYILPEGVAGFTELMRHRVVVPFDGSYPRLRRVIRHELVHFFMYRKLGEVYSRHRRFDYGRPPFWYIEGLSEYLSTDWDSFSDMFLADALYSGALVPLPEWRSLAGTYLGYREGESALHYLADTYGEDKIVQILDYAWLTRRYDDVIDLVLPVSLEQFDEDWRRELRKRYWPRYAEYDELEALGEELTDGPGLRSGVAWLDADRLVYLSDESGRATLYLMTLGPDGRPAATRKLAEAGKSARHAVVHVYRERLGTFGSRWVAFVARAHARDRLFLYDVAAGKIAEEYEFSDLILLGAPSFSPGGDRLVFRGLTRRGQADLYVVDRDTGERRQLTNDLADDIYPCWTERGIVFASEVDADGMTDYYNLHRLDPETGDIERLTRGPWRDGYPCADDDGALYFTSDRSGRYDVYRLAADGSVSRWSKSLTGVLEAAPRPGGEEGEMALLGLRRQSFNLYLADLAEVPIEPVEAAPPAARHVPETSPPSSYPVQGYKTTFALDYFAGQIAYGPEFGTETGLIFAFADVLNDQNILVQFGNDAATVDEFLKRTSVGVDYYNLRPRLGYGLGAFHYVRDYFDYASGVAGRYYTETRAGGGGTALYPLDRFHRLSGSLYLYELKREWEISEPTETGTKISPYLSGTRDTSLWYGDGPIDGERYHLTFGTTHDLRRNRQDYVYALGDFRHYLRTTQTQAFAFRLAGVGTFGRDARPLYSGGSLSMRGYNWFDFRGTRFVMFNAEYRFPVLKPFGLRTAVGTAPMPAVRGALFFDAGEAWDEDLDRVRGGFGLGVRAMLWGFLVLRTDHTVLTDFKSLGPFVPIKFFIGWSY
ncbi:MAG: PD40 domain-containing protein [Candidatus Coatesbacteria bacterium]|nr:MAG: PD40 domain-containing protein [Candidatus Coatesbacteria bacterium]